MLKNIIKGFLLLLIMGFIVFLMIKAREYKRDDCWARRESATKIVAEEYLTGMTWEFEVPEDEEFDMGWVTLYMNTNGTDWDRGDDIVTGFKAR